MTSEEFTKIKKRIQFCMRHLIPVEVNLNGVHGTYIPTALIQRYSEYQKGIIYCVEMRDEHRVNSTITIGIEAVDWPAEGGGYKLGEENE